MTSLIDYENAHLFKSSPNGLHQMWHMTTLPFIFTHKTLSIAALDIHFKGPLIFDQRHNKCNKVKKNFGRVKDIMNPLDSNMKEKIFY